MDKTIEREFFKAFEFGGVLDDCFDWMNENYNLGITEKLQRPHNEKRIKYYNEILPQQIIEATRLFDDSVLNSYDCPLIAEISNNLDVCKDSTQRDRYIFSLLKPFKRYSDIIHPDEIICKLNSDIKEFEKDLKMWENELLDQQLCDLKVEKAIKEQADACRESIEKRRYWIERLEFVANQYAKIVYRIEEYDEGKQKGIIENCLMNFFGAVNRYAVRLDALLLEHGLNLLWYQNECGIYLYKHRWLPTLGSYIGSSKLARRYIDEALPKFPSPQETQEAIAFPIELDTPRAKKLLQKLINKGFCDEAFKWNNPKALLAYFADKASEYLNLGKGQTTDGNIKISWKPFEALFLIQNKSGEWIKVKGLSGARNDYKKTGDLPCNYDDIDNLF